MHSLASWAALHDINIQSEISLEKDASFSSLLGRVVFENKINGHKIISVSAKKDVLFGMGGGDEVPLAGIKIDPNTSHVHVNGSLRVGLNPDDSSSNDNGYFNRVSKLLMDVFKEEAKKRYKIAKREVMKNISPAASGIMNMFFT